MQHGPQPSLLPTAPPALGATPALPSSPAISSGQGREEWGQKGLRQGTAGLSTVAEGSHRLLSRPARQGGRGDSGSPVLSV